MAICSGTGAAQRRAPVPADEMAKLVAQSMSAYARHQRLPVPENENLQGNSEQSCILFKFLILYLEEG